MRTATIALLTGCSLIAATPALAQPKSPTDGAGIACDKLAATAMMPGVTITSSHAVAAQPASAGAELPPRCEVNGEIDPHTGRDGKRYAIGFTLALPDRWNGRFLFQGGGGLNGTIRPPMGNEASGTLPALARGFAVVSTDSGHKGAVFDASFKADQQAALDFAQGSVGRVTQVAKAIVARHYGKAPAYSYFVGCSTGGREAMLASQRYPTYFDGIIAGAPAMRTGNSNIALSNAATLFAQVAPRAGDGPPRATDAFSPAQKTLIVTTLLKQCDALDGVRDGLIGNPGACHFDLTPITCSGTQGSGSCLTPAQAEAIRKAFAGPINGLGQPIYTAYPYDTGIADAAGGKIAGFLAGNGAPVGPPAGVTINLDARQASVMADPFQSLQDTAYWTNLSTFAGRGGKLIFYHGVSDPWFSALDTVRYYESLQAENGSTSPSGEAFSRLFLVPGMGHCSGGSATLDSFDALSALVAWVEKGEAPKSLIATGKDFPGRSRPLCPFPQHAQYLGRGDPERAENFECRG